MMTAGLLQAPGPLTLRARPRPHTALPRVRAVKLMLREFGKMEVSLQLLPFGSRVHFASYTRGLYPAGSHVPSLQETAVVSDERLPRFNELRLVFDYRLHSLDYAIFFSAGELLLLEEPLPLFNNALPLFDDAVPLSDERLLLFDE